MIEPLRNKTFRYLVVESQLRIYLIVLILLVVLIIFEIRVVISKEQELNAVKAEWKLVSQIPEMELVLLKRQALLEQKRREQERLERQEKLVVKKIEEKEVVPEVVETIPLLEGITRKGDVTVALIEGEIYEDGDQVAGYLIKEVSLTEVLLLNLKTGEDIRLYLEKE